MTQLTEEDLQFLREQKDSAHFKTFARCIEIQYEVEASHLVNCRETTDLFRQQGILLGLKKALGIVAKAQMPVEELAEKPKTKPVQFALKDHKLVVR